MRNIWKVVLGFFASVGLLVFIGTVGGTIFVLTVSEEPEALPDRFLLRISLDGTITDAPRPDSFLAGAAGTNLRDVVEALQVAAGDDRVGGLAVYLGSPRIDVATAQELRDAIAGFRASGKPAGVFTEDLGSMGGGMTGYYLASAFDRIWLQPSGGVGLIGMAIEVPFGRGLLDKLEVTPRFGQRHEFKSAVESYTRDSLSGPARENLRLLLASLFRQEIAGIAVDRGIAEDQLRAIVDKGPYLAGEALERGLVDRLGYWDEFIDDAKTAAGDDGDPVFLGRYLARIDRPNGSGPKVALIHGSGAITDGSAEDGGPFSDPGFSAHHVAAAISDAIEDDDVKAILFRVNSPGGSYVASDIVWREVRRARDAGKPVIVSMAGVAASGGYFVAMPANRIVAQPGTITGSIGVYGGKLVTEKLWRRVGVTWDSVEIGARAGMWSFVHDFPPGGDARLAAMLDFIYDDFTGKAMADRGLDASQIDAIARGRVWSGEDALAHGLVDVLGGYTVAIAEVKAALGLGPDEDITLDTWPKPLKPFEQIVKFLGGDAAQGDVAAMLPAAVGADPLTMLARELGLPAEELAALRQPAGVLQMPPLRIRY